MSCRNQTRRGIAIVLIAMLGTALASCGRKQTGSTRYLRMGFVEYNNDTYITELAECFSEDIQVYQTEDMNITVMVKNAAGSQRTQDNLVGDLIDSGCDVLLINLVDRAAGSNIIDLATARDIPVIFFNREPVHEDLMRGENLYYVGSNAKESGVMQGELAAQIIKDNPDVDRNKDGKIQFVVLQGESGHQDKIVRTENAVATLEENGVELDKLSYSIANWSRAQGMARMSQLITQYGSEIEMVLSNNDDMALGAVDAYDQTNMTEASRPIILGVDGTKEGLQAVADGTLAATVYHDKEGQASAMAELAMTLVNGEEPEEFTFEKERCIYVSFEKVTQENVEAYINR